MTSRIHRLPLLLDAAVLALVLVVLVLTASPGTVYMSDEGNVYLQARYLVEGEWVVPYEFADLDSTLEMAHLQRGLRTPTGVAPYVRHPLHAILVTPVFRAFGIGGFVALGILGVVATAWVSAALGRLVDARWARPLFWIVGLASPLAFHAHLWLAHSVTAAIVGLAALMTLRATTSTWLWGIGAGLAAALAASFRSEALLVGPALGVMVGVAWLAKRVSLNSALVSAASLGLMPLGVWLGERAFAEAVFGSTSMTVQIQSLNSGWTGFLDGFRMTMLYSSYVETVLFWFLAAAPILLWHVGRRARATGDARPVVLVSIGVTALLGLRLFAFDVWPIPGLWVAFPIGVLLMSQVAFSEAKPVHIAVPTGAAFLIWIGILVTQYPVGGGLEWGGRYFAIIIPLLAPALAVGLGHVAAWREAAVLVRLAVVSTIALLGIQIMTVGALHNSSARFTDDLRVTGSTIEDKPRGEPVVLAVDVITLSYVTTDAFDEFDWITASRLDLYSEGLAILDAVGAREVIIVGEPTVPDPPGWQLESSTVSAYNMEVRVYTR